MCVNIRYCISLFGDNRDLRFSCADLGWRTFYLMGVIMIIYLNEIFDISKNEYEDWTICLNHANYEQVYSFEENSERLLEHISWKKRADQNTSFRNINTKYCLQFIRLDKDQKWEQWLFLGAYLNLGVNNFSDGHQTYDLKPIDRYSHFIERLIVEYKKKQGPKQAKINISNIETMPVITILEKKYIQVNKLFNGYDKISLPFQELKTIIKGNVDNWRVLLENVNGIYAITDSLTGKIYIGSTYGYNGIWQRWSFYVNTNGHGGDVVLKNLIELNPNYENNFTILEIFFNRDGNAPYILERENYWKKVFSTRTFGNNKN